MTLMKSRIVPHYTYRGLGIPVELWNVQVDYVDGQWCPVIDVKKVAKDTYKYLMSIDKTTPGEREFMRKYEEQ